MTEPPASPKKILVIEDSELLHQLYDLVLIRFRHAGSRVLHARNGQEGLDLLARHPDTDVILLDIVMPVMDGLEFLRVRRERHLAEKTPVILCTTKGREEDIRRGLAEGADAYLTKPIQPAEVAAEIQRLLAPRAGKG